MNTTLLTLAQVLCGVIAVALLVALLTHRRARPSRFTEL